MQLFSVFVTNIFKLMSSCVMNLSCYCKRNFPSSAGLFGYNKSA